MNHVGLVRLYFQEEALFQERCPTGRLNRPGISDDIHSCAMSLHTLPPWPVFNCQRCRAPM